MNKFCAACQLLNDDQNTWSSMSYMKSYSLFCHVHNICVCLRLDGTLILLLHGTASVSAVFKLTSVGQLGSSARLCSMQN
jgi:hypothetical protein